MKLKNLFTGLSCAMLAIFLIGCKKKVPNVAPQPDTNITGVVDVTRMLQHLTDIEMISANISEQNFLENHYMPQRIDGNGTVTPVFDIPSSTLFQAFNLTKCTDNVLREGTVNLSFRYEPERFPRQTMNSIYAHAYGFVGSLTLSEYVANGYRIKTRNGEPVLIMNQLPSANADLSAVKLSWSVNGVFEITPPNQPNQQMVMEISLIKTLENSTDKNVYPKNGYINWNQALVSYSGVIKGKHFDGSAFTMTISSEQPLVRDFSCVPDQNEGGTISQNVPFKIQPSTYHPFVSGIASYMPQQMYRREIYYGNEGDNRLPYQCDSKAMVLIQGNAYPVDF